MNSRGLLSLALSLLTGAAALVALAPAPAGAAVQPCGPLNGLLTFDDEAGTSKLIGAAHPPGAYLPATPAANRAPYAALLRSFSVTLTYATCDTDGCALVASATKTGCPPATRTATLTYVNKKHRLAVSVGSVVPGCRAGAKVTLLRKKKGRDTKLLVSTTNSKGRYRVKAPRTGGRYYVTVARSYAEGQAECGTARSKATKVTARRSLPSTRSAAGPDSDGDGLDDTSDGCPGAASKNPTGCPTVSRGARLRYLMRKDRLQATITSTATACYSRSRIKLWRVEPGVDSRVLVGTAYASGRYRFVVAGGASYYVTVSTSYAPGVAECAEVTSRTVAVPR